MNSKCRDMVITALEHLDDRHTPEQQKILQGVRAILKGDRDAEMRYREAVKAGATKMVLPASVEETGYASVPCCGLTDFGQYPSPDRVELSLYEFNVHTCPRCGMVWALRITQPED